MDAFFFFTACSTDSPSSRRKQVPTALFTLDLRSSLLTHSSLFTLHFPVASEKPLIIGMGGRVFPFSITAIA